MFYMYYQGKWENPDPKLVQELADEIIRNAIKYGVACYKKDCKVMIYEE